MPGWRSCRCWRPPPLPSAVPASVRPPRATKADADVPVAVGFGIGTPAQVAEVGEIADGVIVGSRLVRAAGDAGSAGAAAREVGKFLGDSLAALAA